MLLILDAPSNISLTSNRTILNNMSQTTLTCNATGNPSPNVSLYKDGKLLKTGLEQVMLEFQPVTVNLTGWYTCEASNDVGIKTKKTYLDIQCK